MRARGSLLAGLAAFLVAFTVFASWRERARVESASAVASPSASTQMLQAATGSLGAGGLTQWQFLGPGNAGGPTSFVAFRPDNANVAYAVTHGGDVFRSEDAATSWTFQSHLPLREAKLELVAGHPQTMYAYGGRVAEHAPPNTMPLLKSTDGGETWAELIPQPFEQGQWLRTVRYLRAVPNQPDVLWATTQFGLVRSTDGGLNWTVVYGGSCSDLEISLPKSRVYAACATTAWNVVAAELDGSGWTQLTQRTDSHSYSAQLALAKSDPDVIYLATFGDGQQTPLPAYLGSVIRSTDGGLTWETRYDRSVATDAVSRAIPGDFEGECQAPDNGRLTVGSVDMAVDPANSGLLWIAGFEIYRSDDGGATFGRVRARADRIEEPQLGVSQRMTSKARYSSLAFPANYNGATAQTLLAGGRAGIERTDSARAEAQTASTLTCGTAGAEPAMPWSAVNKGYSAARIVHGNMLANGEIVVSGPDMDVGVSDGSGPDNWARVTPLRGSAVGHVSIDSTRGTDRFITTWSSGLANWAWDEAQSKWVATTTTFWSLGGYWLDPEDDVYADWIYPEFARDPKDPTHLAVATEEGVFESKDNGDTWTLISHAVSATSIGFLGDGRLLAATADDYQLLQVAPGSQEWEALDLSGCLLVAGHACNGANRVRLREFQLSPNPHDPGIYATAAATFSKPKVWYSPDGRSWQALDRMTQPGGLPTAYSATTLAIDPDNSRHLFAGTAVGLFVTVDRGQSWTEVETPFPGTPISKLEFHKDPVTGARRLVAFTYGRGVWSAAVAASTTFSDIPTSFWAYSFVQKLYEAGITGGCSTTPLAYCPTNAVSRDQMAVFLLRAKHGRTYQPPAASGDFSDVPTTHWAAAWIERLRDEGITGGCGTNPLRYCPTATVSRDQMAVFLLRAKHGASYQPPAATGVFADVPTSHWAAPWIEQLAREGISGGCSTTSKNFCPNSAVTRDQMAVFLVRAFGL